MQRLLCQGRYAEAWRPPVSNPLIDPATPPFRLRRRRRPTIDSRDLGSNAPSPDSHPMPRRHSGASRATRSRSSCGDRLALATSTAWGTRPPPGDRPPSSSEETAGRFDTAAAGVRSAGTTPGRRGGRLRQRRCADLSFSPPRDRLITRKASGWFRDVSQALALPRPRAVARRIRRRDHTAISILLLVASPVSPLRRAGRNAQSKDFPGSRTTPSQQGNGPAVGGGGRGGAARRSGSSRGLVPPTTTTAATSTFWLFKTATPGLFSISATGPFLPSPMRPPPPRPTRHGGADVNKYGATGGFFLRRSGAPGVFASHGAGTV